MIKPIFFSNRDTDAFYRLHDETMLVPYRAADQELDRLAEIGAQHPEGADLARRLARPRTRQTLREHLVHRAARTFARDRAFANRLRALDGEKALAAAMRGWLVEIIGDHPAVRAAQEPEAQLEDT